VMLRNVITARLRRISTKERDSDGSSAFILRTKYGEKR